MNKKNLDFDFENQKYILPVVKGSRIMVEIGREEIIAAMKERGWMFEASGGEFGGPANDIFRRDTVEIPFIGVLYHLKQMETPIYEVIERVEATFDKAKAGRLRQREALLESQTKIIRRMRSQDGKKNVLITRLATAAQVVKGKLSLHLQEPISYGESKALLKLREAIKAIVEFYEEEQGAGPDIECGGKQ